jgi:hypothetical protein
MGRRRTDGSSPIFESTFGVKDPNTKTEQGQSGSTATTQNPGGGPKGAVISALKIAQQKSAGKKKELPFSPSTFSRKSAPKKMGRGKGGPISSVASALGGTGSGGSVRL